MLQQIINFILSLFRKTEPIEIDGKIDAGALADLSRSLTQYIWTFDSWYVCVKRETWATILSDVLLNMPSYVNETFDCDDFSLVSKARVAEKYQVNTIALVLGDTPMGYHAWNAIYTEGEILFLEPQTGEIWKPKDKNYNAEWIIW